MAPADGIIKYELSKLVGKFDYVLTALIVAAGCFVVEARPEAATADEVQVLFIGNSLTYVNDLPQMLTELGRADGRRIVTARETPGGCTLEKHWQDGKALDQIRSRQWDYVVLQDQSQMPLVNRAAMFEYARKFVAEIRKEGAEPILYMTWCQEDHPEQQATISRAYLDLGKELKVLVVPVGNAFQSMGKLKTRTLLYADDQRHPSPAGTYLAACVFYSTLFNRSAEGLPGNIARLADEPARALQTTAWRTVRATSN